jgi:hypothetical protein
MLAFLSKVLLPVFPGDRRQAGRGKLSVDLIDDL